LCVEKRGGIPQLQHVKPLFTLLTCALLAFLPACQKSAPVTPAPAAATSAPPATLYLSNAQPRLQTIKQFVGAEELNTELALKPHEMATGMMYRTNMPENEAMLFAFSTPHQVSFYMKNTVVPLSAAYIDPEGVIAEIHDLQPLNEAPVEATTENIQYVLEVPQGWFKRHNISTGAVVRTPIGALKETFRFTRE
jgi:uncharacterized membrane protein (UPF0127 family)